MAEITATRIGYQRWIRVLVATIRTAAGATGERDIEDHGDAAMVLPYDPAHRVATVIRQFRAPARLGGGDGFVLEAPAGRLDGDDPEACARREAMEEAGLRLRILEPVARIFSLPAISTERVSLFLAPYAAADRIAEGGGLAEEQEEIAVIEMPLDELARLADEGGLADAKLMLLVQTLRVRRPELFRPMPHPVPAG